MSKTNVLAVGVSNGSVFEAKIRESNKEQHASFDFRYVIFDEHFLSKIMSLQPDVVIVDCLPSGDLKERYPFQTLCPKLPHIAVVGADAHGQAEKLKHKGVQQVVSLEDIQNGGFVRILSSCVAKVKHSDLDVFLSPFLESILDPALIVSADNKILYKNAAARSCFRIGASLIPNQVGVDSPFKSSPCRIAFHKNDHPFTGDISSSAIKWRDEKAFLVTVKNIAPQKSRDQAEAKEKAPASPNPGHMVQEKQDDKNFFAPTEASPAAMMISQAEKKKLQQENQTLEQQLLQSQKLETLGTLTGGIAHDFNNLLTPIMGYADIGAMKSHGDHTLHEYFELIKEASERAKELVTQMLNFSRRSEISKTPLLLQPFIKKSIKLIRSSIPSTVAIDLDLETASHKVMTHPAHIQQILMNLCTNAYHAMPDQKGVISIKLKTATPGSAAFDKYASLDNRSFAWLSVKDDGMGIDAEKIEHIFDPFFTTKEAGKGTGLGLSIVKGIVKNSGGKVFVESSPGNGTTFNIFLPIAQHAPKRKAKMKQEITQGKGRILVVDDEPAIVGLLKDMLTAFGYTPIGTEDPREALHLFENENDSIDLVLTDLTMPNLPGLELAKQMQAINPAIPIIVLTGYCESVSDDLLSENCIFGVLDKPMVVGEVAGAIQKALQARLAA